MNSKDGKIKILAVSNESTILAELEGVLKSIFPLAEIIKETDPLMACKYSFNNEVNVAFASEDMKRMSGSDLLQFIKKERPSVKTYLIFGDEEASKTTICEDADGTIFYPFSTETVKTAIG